MEQIQHHLHMGNSLFVEEDYTNAVDQFTMALTRLETTTEAPIAPHNNNNMVPATTNNHSHNYIDQARTVRYKCLTHRAAALLRLEMYEKALEDVRAAAASISNEQQQLQCERLCGRVALALELYEEAKEAFHFCLMKDKNNKKAVEEYRAGIDKCNNANICEKMMPVNDSATSTVINDRSSQAQSQPKITSSPHRQQQRMLVPKYQYYQSDTVLTIIILEAGLTEETLKVNFGEDSLSVVVKRQGENENYKLLTVIYGTLFDAVIVDKCRIKFKEEKTLIKLYKRDKGEWHELMGSGDSNKKDKSNTEKMKSMDTDELAAVPNDVPGTKDETLRIDANKSRPYASTKDWNAIEKDLKRQEETEEPQGEEALNKLFQQIYRNADEDTRRAMIKSYQTSGGTCLSTNWTEVSEKDYEAERQAPKGMEWKNYEGDRLPQKDDD